MGIAITLSRQLGAGGEEVACGVAAELGLRIVGRDLVHEAVNGCVLENPALEAEEQKPALINRVMDFLRGKPAVPASPAVLNLSDPGVLSTSIFRNDEYYKSVLESVVYDLTQTGDVLILGQAGQMILHNDPKAFHVRIVAPTEKRIETVRQRLGVSEEEARRQVEASDRSRMGYLRRRYGVDIDNANLYDLTFNTATISKDSVVRLIVEAVKAAGLK